MEGPDWFTSPLREVRCEPLFLEQIDALGIDPEKLDEALSALDYVLSKRPEVFPSIPFTPFSRALVYIYQDAPPLRVFFTYDAVQVKLVSVEFAE
jgi:hypothetical protein